MRYFFRVILPPLAVMFRGKPLLSLLNIVLTVLSWVPGVIHALLVVHDHKQDVRAIRFGRADLVLKQELFAVDHRPGNIFQSTGAIFVGRNVPERRFELTFHRGAAEGGQVQQADDLTV